MPVSVKAMDMEDQKPIRSFKDLDVYRNAYQAMKDVMICVVPDLPNCEKYDLADQMRRAARRFRGLLRKDTRNGIKRRDFRNILMMPWLSAMR